jgi:hypothetical protein
MGQHGAAPLSLPALAAALRPEDLDAVPNAVPNARAVLPAASPPVIAGQARRLRPGFFLPWELTLGRAHAC